MKGKNHNRTSMCCSINPDIVTILDEVLDDYFYRTRSKLIERIFLDWFEQNEIISHRDRVLLENCYKEGGE